MNEEKGFLHGWKREHTITLGIILLIFVFCIFGCSSVDIVHMEYEIQIDQHGNLTAICEEKGE